MGCGGTTIVGPPEKHCPQKSKFQQEERSARRGGGGYSDFTDD